jgi:hypothetical protein
VTPEFDQRNRGNVNPTDQTQSAWRKSSYCGTNACVEVAATDTGALMRDSKLDDSPILAFDHHTWRGFLEGVRAGDYDLR